MKIWSLPKDIKVLIFDIDSTLYTNEEYAHEQIDSQVRHFAKLRGISAEEARTLVSDFRRKWALEHQGQKISLGNLLTHFGISIEESIEWRKTLFDPAHYLKHDSKLVKTIEELSTKYYIICVTNNPVLPARKTLEAIGISHLIPQIIGLDTTGKSKPAKEIFDLAIKTASEHLPQTSEDSSDKKITYKNCISIGDRFDIDLALPLELGMGAILVDGVSDVYNIPAII